MEHCARALVEARGVRDRGHERLQQRVLVARPIVDGQAEDKGSNGQCQDGQKDAALLRWHCTSPLDQVVERLRQLVLTGSHFIASFRLAPAVMSVRDQRVVAAVVEVIIVVRVVALNAHVERRHTADRLLVGTRHVV